MGHEETFCANCGATVLIKETTECQRCGDLLCPDCICESCENDTNSNDENEQP